MDRTRAFQLVTRLPRRWVVAADRSAREHRPVALALAPLRGWLRGGSARVAAGRGEGLRLALGHLPASHSQARPLVRGRAEPLVQDALADLVAPGAVVYDLGANVGFFSLLAARLTGPGGRVIAVEPEPGCATAVAANARLNGLDNVTVLQRAAGAAAGRERLWVVVDGSWSHLESRGRHPLASGSVDVEVVALDDLVEAGEIPPPAVVKLDVEGSEVDALRGLRRTLARHRPALVCELHETGPELDVLCGELGYRATVLETGEDLRAAGPNDHVVALPATGAPS